MLTVSIEKVEYPLRKSPSCMEILTWRSAPNVDKTICVISELDLLKSLISI